MSPWIDRTRFERAGNRFPLSVSLLSWAYNEEENIAEFLVRAREFMDALDVDYEHILIDDASRDRTFEIATQVGETYPRLRIIRNPKNLDSGWNTRIAISHATRDVLFWQTVDWAYDISEIGRYLRLLRDFDVIQGVRLFTGTNTSRSHLANFDLRTRSDDPAKAIISLMNYLLVRYLFGVPLMDFQNVTIYPTKLAQSIHCESSSSFTNPELIIKAFWMGASIAQVPINFLPRRKGEAKGTRWRSVAASVRQIFFYWFRWIILNKRSPGRPAARPAKPGSFALPDAADDTRPTRATG